MFKLEYAQKINGKFAAWQDAGIFATREKAFRLATERGLLREGDDYLITHATYDAETDEWV